MATVVITFFLLTRFYVCKMDADCIDRRRDRILSRREKRWSMNSQRLEEIVAELMKPISDVRRSFDTDLSALLEEYLTEAGLHALDASEDDDDAEAGASAGAGAGAVAPNFAELALLLQHSASVYGRKVDFLYQHVLSVSDSLQQSTQEIERSTTENEAEATPGGRGRRRASAGGFAALELAASAAALREAGAARPPPTLPRAYIELEPRSQAAADLPLTDYDAEPVGLLADFHVSWRLQDGLLVDELAARGGGGALRPIPLMELQAAIEAAAPPALPPPPPDLDPPPHCPSPAPAAREASPLPLHASTPLPPPEPVKKERKRKHDVSTDDLVGGCFKIILNKELRRKFRKLEEFSLDDAWIAGVLVSRRDHIRATRRLLRDHDKKFRGFDESELDIGGFAGWSSSEAASALESSSRALAAAGAGAGGAAEGDSDDDGFFEQSSLGDSDASRVDDSLLASSGALTPLDNSAWSSWQASVVARAAAGEARGLDVRELAERLLRHLPPAADTDTADTDTADTDTADTAVTDVTVTAAAPLVHCDTLLRDAARDHHDVPGLFLATLFLANAGNVELVAGAPLSLNSFSARLLSADARLYCAAAAHDPHFLR